MTPGNPAAAEAGSDREIIITRTFDAPRALVFKAWTDPRCLARWWGPKGCVSTIHEMDVRVGGSLRLEMHGANGAVYPCHGIYQEIKEPERIVLSGPMDCGVGCGAGVPPRSVVTVTFAEKGGKTTLTIHARFETDEDRRRTAETGYFEGWTSTLERLEDELVFIDERAT